MELASTWLRVGGLRLHARRGGSGRAVVLVHGIGVSSRYLVPLGRELAESSAVAAPDLPGFGRSESPRRALTVRGLADALRAWLGAAGIEEPLLVANSMGCQVVVELAVREPALARGLVLIGPTVDPRYRTVARHAPRFAVDATREPPSLLAIIAFDYARFGPLRFAATARSALADRPEEKLPHVVAPTLVVKGDRDGFVSSAWAREVARLLPRGRLLIVAREPHAVHYSRPVLLAAAIAAFAEELEHEPRQVVGRVPHRDVPRADDR